ncbi:hypothetical protein RyT2_14080 [Pseudolactococcus yaeyamensis]
MEKQTKKTIGIAVGVIAFLAVGYLANKYLHPPKKAVTVSEFVKDVPKKEKAEQDKTDEKVDVFDDAAVKEKLGLPSDDATSSGTPVSESSSAPSSSESSIKRVEDSLTSYFTVDLDQEKISKRNLFLKTALSPELYESETIERNSQILEQMLDNWNEKKQLDTNQPVQLLSQSIDSLTVYSDTKSLQEVTHLAVQVSLTLTSPLSKTPNKVTRWYEVEQSGGLITAIKLIDEKGN